jgi:hypothetical protein
VRRWRTRRARAAATSSDTGTEGIRVAGAATEAQIHGVTDGVQGVGDQEASQDDGGGVPPGRRKQQGGADADLEGTEVVQEVLVVGEGNETGKRAGAAHAQMPAASMPAPVRARMAVT